MSPDDLKILNWALLFVGSAIIGYTTSGKPWWVGVSFAVAYVFILKTSLHFLAQ